MDLRKYFILAAVGMIVFPACDNNGPEVENKVFISADSYAPEMKIQTDEHIGTMAYDLTLGMVSPLERDVRIVIDKAPELLDTYRNAYYDATARLLPETSCNFGRLEASITSSSVSSEVLTIEFTGLDKLDYATNYVMPLTIVESDGVEVMESAKTIYMVISEASLINTVADINDNLAWVDWKDKSRLKDMSVFTLEALIYANTYANEEISTIMGIEDNFLIRAGDRNCSKNMLNVAYGKKIDGQDLNSRGSVKVEKPLLETGRWQHIAVVFDNGKIDVYIDGKRAGGCEEAKVENGETLTRVDFTTGQSVDGTSRPNEDEGRPRAFWFGYSYDNKRDFDGMIAEARIWEKALTAEEINAENHFWKVRPDSEGLVAYWKFNDNTGNVIKDHTEYGNNLIGDHTFLWVNVQLPQ